MYWFKATLLIIDKRASAWKAAHKCSLIWR
jgi:hypothetical protein